MKQSYKVNHPRIKEISIGDQFVLNNGEIVTFVEYDEAYDKGTTVYPFAMDGGWYSVNLTNASFKVETEYHIKYKLLSLKDKIDLL